MANAEAMRRPAALTDQALRENYCLLGLTQKQIAQKYGTTRRVVARAMADIALPRRDHKHRSRGAQRYNWRGDAATKHSGHGRAERLYVLPALCERCGQRPACDRHHKDGDTTNNGRENIEFLCRRCHIVGDGRLAALAAKARGRTKPVRPCSNCGCPYAPLRKGRCNACRQYWRTYGRERQSKREGWLQGQEGEQTDG